MKYRYTQEKLNEVYKLVGCYLNRQYEVDTDNPVLVFYPQKTYAYPVLMKGVASSKYPVILSSQQIQEYVAQYRVANEKRALTKQKVIFFKELSEACEKAEKELLAGKDTKDTTNVLVNFEKENKKELKESFEKYSKLYSYTRTFSNLDKETLVKRTNAVYPKYGKILGMLLPVVTYSDFVKAAYKISYIGDLAYINATVEAALSRF